MADILPFRPHPPRSVDRLAPTEQLDVRAEIEAAAQYALDTADRLIAVLDDMDGDPAVPEGAMTEPPEREAETW